MQPALLENIPKGKLACLSICNARADPRGHGAGGRGEILTQMHRNSTTDGAGILVQPVSEPTAMPASCISTSDPAPC